jgi:hypothetical protein
MLRSRAGGGLVKLLPPIAISGFGEAGQWFRHMRSGDFVLAK